MPHPPGFWRRDGVLPRLLSPLAAVTAAVTAWRVARPGWRAPVPVICCGNVTVGGAGKTTLALDVGARLVARGVAVHFILRGYGGSVRGPHRVVAGDTAAGVGDEALLLAEVAPTWIGADRAASARAAVAAGAQVLVMDDGLQNPGLHKDLSLLVVDGASGFGNGRVLPAGPLREPVRGRGGALPGGGADRAGLCWSAALPVLLVQSACLGQRSRAGWAAACWRSPASPGQRSFSPCWRMRASSSQPRCRSPIITLSLTRTCAACLTRRIATGAAPVTTPKDAVRLPVEYRDHIGVVGVSLAWDDPGALDELLARYV